MERGTIQINFREKGQARLEVERIFQESTVTGAYATSPMKLLTPRSRGQCVSAFASNLGGGLVAGDQTRLELRVGKQARCFVSTQASTKIYRNPHNLPCSHATRATVESDGMLVLVPAPVQPFAHSHYQQKQEFHLAAGAGLVLLDWFTSGRAACGERWRFAHLSTRNEVWQEPGGCVFLDSCCLDADKGWLDCSYVTGRFNCFAMLVLIGPPFRSVATALLEAVSRTAAGRRSPLLVTASPIQDGAVLRLAAEQVSEADKYVRTHLAALAGVLGEDPWSRRW